MPLYRASKSGYVAVVKQLLEKGADAAAAASRYGWTPLQEATYNGHNEIFMLLHEHDGQ
jgi:ankyrin repeat protein